MTDAAIPLDPELYRALRALARRYRRRHGAETLDPTGLVHEAWVRLASRRFENRDHYAAVAARAIRQVLVDRSRRRNAARRGGDRVRITLTALGSDDPTVDLMALDQALDRLEAHDRRQAEVAHLRLFAGYTVLEIAGALGVAESTVEKDWRRARAWLGSALEA